jgi:hypothetical protein
MTLEHRLCLATRADAALLHFAKTGLRRTLKGSRYASSIESVQSCYEGSHAYSEALKHPVSHRYKITQVGTDAQYTGSCTWISTVSL